MGEWVGLRADGYAGECVNKWVGGKINGCVGE